MAWRSALSSILKPHPLGLFLTAPFIYILQNFSEYQQVLALGTLYFILSNATFNLKKVKLKKIEVLPTPFLLALSKNLKRSSPEVAFLSAFESTQARYLDPVIRKVRNGVQLAEALKSIKSPEKGEALLPLLLSDLFYFDSEGSSKRISAYVAYRKESERIRSALSVRMSAISFRFKVLCLICSSSLAVVAFAAPILYSITGLNRVVIQSLAFSIFSLDPAIIIPCISTAVVSTYTYSKLLPGLSGLKLSFLSAAIFTITELALLMVIGWSI